MLKGKFEILEEECNWFNISLRVCSGNEWYVTSDYSPSVSRAGVRLKSSIIYTCDLIKNCNCHLNNPSESFMFQFWALVLH